jgi:hypothetical protein
MQRDGLDQKENADKTYLHSLTLYLKQSTIYGKQSPKKYAGHADAFVQKATHHADTVIHFNVHTHVFNG